MSNIISDAKQTSKKNDLNDKYLNLYLKFIKDSKSLSPEESILFKKSLEDITNYVTSIILSIISQRSSLNSSLDKKLITLYNKNSYLYENPSTFTFKIAEEMYDLALEAIYEALGFSFSSNKSKTFKYLDEKSNIIHYISTLFYYKVLNKLEKNLKSIESFSEDIQNDNILSTSDIIEIDENLDKKKVKLLFGEKKFNEIREILISGTTIIPKDLLNIIEYIKK